MGFIYIHKECKNMFLIHVILKTSEKEKDNFRFITES